MRIAVAAAVLLAAGPARADRTMSSWLGLTLDERASGSSFSAAGNSSDLSTYGGARLTLSFDEAPPPIPLPGAVAFEGRLVPELLAGFLADDVQAEGYIGAGLRAEVWMSSHRHDFAMRTAIYLAARAIAIGGHQDGAAEMVLGEYLVTGRNGVFGWEGGAMMRARNDVPTSVAQELDAMLTIYVGWR